MTLAKDQRLFFLDWLRIIAFFVLILYHVGMYYVSWDWHVKSVDASSAIEPLMRLSSPWRLGLLFLISGVASSFMLSKLSASSFMRQRSFRLLLPLVFGMFVIVPPQPYLEVVEKVAYAGSYGDFMRLYLSAYPGFCRGTDCLDLPTWNHLWFVVYLWVYTLLLGTIVLAFGARFNALARRVGDALTGWKVIVLPLAVLAAIRLLLVGRFPTTHALVDDWYAHADFFSLFMIGALVAQHHGFWQEVARLRWAALGIALACWACISIYFAIPDTLLSDAQVQVLRPLQRVAYAACEWCAIVAACGFARAHLQFDSDKRRYLAQAVFPVYILHQSLIVVFAHYMKPMRFQPGVEALILVVLTLTISFGVFELVRRVGVLRPLFGLAPLPNQGALTWAAQ
jgi:glucan biosynthesis protein C